MPVPVTRHMAQMKIPDITGTAVTYADMECADNTLFAMKASMNSVPNETLDQPSGLPDAAPKQPQGSLM